MQDGVTILFSGDSLTTRIGADGTRRVFPEWEPAEPTGLLDIYFIFRTKDLFPRRRQR
jgi:hypothetical protein